MSDPTLDATRPRMSAPYDRWAIEALMARYGSPLVMIDCDVVRAQYRALAEALPGVDLHYALKPLPERCVVEVLRDLGSYFDLATSGEVDLVRKAGVDPRRCIHTHPIKRDSDIRDATRYGVRTFVADNPDELGKFVRHRTRCEVILRVAFRNAAAKADLSRKFGCDPESVPALLDLARRLGVKVVGLSFHVGSQSPTPDMHVHAIERCNELIVQARAEGHSLTVLDIGGGFPAVYRSELPPIADFCAPIRAALAALPPGMRIVAEPGRFIVASAGTSLSTVVGRALRDGVWWFYLDDGLYGSYNGHIFDDAEYDIRPLRDDGSRVKAVLAGPTCDSIDVVKEEIDLPLLEIGDVIVGSTMGAYTSSSATDFNFIRRAKVIAVNEAEPVVVHE
jgi:ornithine decarboxylase